MRNVLTARAIEILRAGPLAVAVVLGLAASGCGGGSGGAGSGGAGSGGAGSGGAGTAAPPTQARASATTRSSTAGQAVAVPAARVSILSPSPGSHTGSTVTVSVAVRGASGAATRRFRYVLDHRFTRSGASHVTFHDVAPGRHRLEVLLTSDATGHAATTFVVRAPAPPVAPAVPVQAPHATTGAERRAPTTTPSRPPAVRAPSPPPTTKSRPPAPTTTSPRPSPPAAGGIPQGGGGDGDGDNSGGPSDGDGNI